MNTPWNHHGTLKACTRWAGDAGNVSKEEYYGRPLTYTYMRIQDYKQNLGKIGTSCKAGAWPRSSEQQAYGIRIEVCKGMLSEGRTCRDDYPIFGTTMELHPFICQVDDQSASPNR